MIALARMGRGNSSTPRFSGFLIGWFDFGPWWLLNSTEGRLFWLSDSFSLFVIVVVVVVTPVEPLDFVFDSTVEVAVAFGSCLVVQDG